MKNYRRKRSYGAFKEATRARRRRAVRESSLHKINKRLHLESYDEYDNDPDEEFCAMNDSVYPEEVEIFIFYKKVCRANINNDRKIIADVVSMLHKLSPSQFDKIEDFIFKKYYLDKSYIVYTRKDFEDLVAQENKRHKDGLYYVIAEGVYGLIETEYDDYSFGEPGECLIDYDIFKVYLR